MQRVLVVDDDPSIRRVIGKTLRRKRYDCEFAASVLEACAALEKTDFDVIISDIDMPGGSGVELLHRLKALTADPALIYVTAEDDPDVAARILEDGAHAYLVKPFEANQILITVSDAVLRRDQKRSESVSQDALRTRVRKKSQALAKAELALRASEEDTIYLLCTASEFRDNETTQHTQRMSRYCGLLARELGFSPERSESLRTASLMHDLGKIAIPDSVLLKPGRLTEEEFDIIRAHAEIGHRILSSSESELLQLAATIAMTHHERFDGTGYPAGLKGSQIPIEGRIAAVADVFDAVTTNRVYRDAWPVDQGFAYLVEQKSKHFDPTLVDLFVEAADDVIAIKNQYPNERASSAPLSNSPREILAARMAVLR